MTVLDRLPTKNRLIAFGLQVDGLCVLCRRVMEFCDQLFFQFDFSKKVWEEILRLFHLNRMVMCWDSKFTWAPRLRARIKETVRLRLAGRKVSKLGDGYSQICYSWNLED
ncbi:uncharacterized protein LOC120180971 [Hibiscus syriacus]|uniref:uncharacterized protein LOC120180971 n=1 Tax=Hibiscus syriacus TaxID=106335 RepID=UPI001921A9FA|nr:uncharacterized protein LOC120180971 [Hibiscus syriacus]